MRGGNRKSGQHVDELFLIALRVRVRGAPPGRRPHFRIALQHVDELFLIALRVRVRGAPPGRRTSYPHAESDEEEFIYVLEGYPEVWIKGDRWKLEPGDSVGFPAGTGICPTFPITPAQEVRLLVGAEAHKKT
ncbi:cupin domain-containing protein, partial [Klebsiella variicola]|uniref:cupin domain-containing protein n=1 Tax=Klebsiella variicola TaxID=244366 RepID=UPI003F678F21